MASNSLTGGGKSLPHGAAVTAWLCRALASRLHWRWLLCSETAFGGMLGIRGTRVGGQAGDEAQP